MKLNLLEDPVIFYRESLKKHGGYIPAQTEYYNEFMSKYFSPIVQESTVRQLLAYKHLISGKIYTYSYDPQGADILNFYDRRPIMLSIKNFKAETTGNDIELGINLNFLPPKMRMFLLQRLYQTYHNIIDRNFKQMEKGNILNQKPLFTGTYDFIKVLDYLFDSVGNTAYRFALRNYIYDRMSNIKAIDYNDYGKLLFIDSKDTTGSSIGEIYQQYYRFKQTFKRNKTKKK